MLHLGRREEDEFIYVDNQLGYPMLSKNRSHYHYCNVVVIHFI